jgi:hypothetical protein
MVTCRHSSLSVVTAPCPQWPSGHATERGLLWAHYRIWKDFVYFDWLLDKHYDAYKRRTTAPSSFSKGKSNSSNVATRNSTMSTILTGVNVSSQSISSNTMPVIPGSGMTWSPTQLISEDGIYSIDLQSGNRYKQGQLISDNDIMAVFEDDAMAVTTDVNTTIIQELSNIGTDILHLGWCDGFWVRPVPLCAHAYALTRSGAEKVIKYLEPCGRALDEQLTMIIRNGWLTYRRALPSSYKNLQSGVRIHGDKTHGIFRQCKDACGSVNGHRRRQR